MYSSTRFKRVHSVQVQRFDSNFSRWLIVRVCIFFRNSVRRVRYVRIQSFDCNFSRRVFICICIFPCRIGRVRSAYVYWLDVQLDACTLCKHSGSTSIPNVGSLSIYVFLDSDWTGVPCTTRTAVESVGRLYFQRILGPRNVCFSMFIRIRVPRFRLNLCARTMADESVRTACFKRIPWPRNSDFNEGSRTGKKHNELRRRVIYLSAENDIGRGRIYRGSKFQGIFSILQRDLARRNFYYYQTAEN